MYSESDIDGAVAAGVMPATTAAAFRDHVAACRQTPAVDEEHFRLVTGFNDIFVAIAIGLLLVALKQIGATFYSPLGGALVAGASWLLAEYFTAQRRMALPSILLLIGFALGTASALGAVFDPVFRDGSRSVHSLALAIVALATAGAIWLHWRRFMVPITVAAGAVALAGAAVALAVAAVPQAKFAIWQILLIAGAAVFALAMRWDLSDRTRVTRRADVAFWLHLAAAPMIAHSIFKLLGVFESDVGVGTALVVLLLYALFGFVALAIDRRALLVSGLSYVLYALYALVRSAGTVELSWAITARVIGSGLLTLSVFWQPMRRLVIGTLGGLGSRLPPIQTTTA